MKMIKINMLLLAVLITIASCGNDNNNNSNGALPQDTTASYQDGTKNNVDNGASATPLNDTINKSNPIVDTNMVK